MVLEIIFYIFMLIFWIVLIASCVYDIRNTKKWDKKMQESHDKLMKDLGTTKTLVEVTNDNKKLMEAIDNANIYLYKTPTGKYILVPKEGK